MRGAGRESIETEEAQAVSGPGGVPAFERSLSLARISSCGPG